MLKIFSDFDGTVTSHDSIVFLTEVFGGGPQYRCEILKRFERGELDLFQIIEEELASVKVPWAAAARALQEEISVDPEFPAFVDWCRLQNYPLSVVSSGIRRVVSLFIGHLDVPFFAHPVEFNSEGWRYRRDHQADKETLLQEASRAGQKIVYIGDGISDISVLDHTDWLFAKSRLAHHCRVQAVPFFPFESFRDIREQLQRLVAAVAPGSPGQADPVP